MRKQALGLSILLLVPSFVAASQADGQSTPSVDLRTLLQLFRGCCVELESAELDKATVQAAIDQFQEQKAEYLAAIKQEISAKVQKRDQLTIVLAKIQKLNHPAYAGSIALKEKQIALLDAEISNAYAQIGETEPKREGPFTQKKAVESPIITFEDDSFINVHEDMINALEWLILLAYKSQY